MIRQWKMFRGGPVGPKRDRLHVTLSKRGVILINHKMFEMMGNPEAAYLLYDEKLQAIGIQPTTTGNQFSFPLKQKNDVTHRTINAQAFCRSFKISPPQTIYFTQPELDHDGVLVLDMHKAEEVTTWTRKQKGSGQ